MFSQCQERSFFCTFYAVCPIGKSSTSKCKFQDLPLLALKFTKFLMSFLEPRISFCSNFASLFSVMRHNSSVLFHLNILHVLGKWIQSKCKFLDFQLLVWKLTKFLMSLFNPQVSFPLNIVTPFSVVTHNSSEIF